MGNVKFEVKIKGLDRLKTAWREAPQTVYNELSKAVNKSAWIITREIQLTSPVDTGTLKRGIRPEFIGGIKAVIKPHNAPYAIYVNQGTRFQKANPFMQRGLASAEDDVNRTFGEAMDNIINKL